MSTNKTEIEARVRELIRNLRTNPDEAIRFEAIQELLSYQDYAEKALPTLIEALQNESDYDVLYLVIEMVGNFGSKADKAVSVLIDLVDTFYDDEELLQLIIETFGKIGKSAKKADKILKQIISDYGEKNIRVFAMHSLVRIIGSDIISLLERIICNEEDDEIVRVEAIRTIAKLGTDEVIAKLTKMLTVINSEEIKVNIEAALGELGVSKVVPKLMARLMDGTQSYERAVAAEALGKIHAKEAIPILLETALRDQDVLVREKAVKALGNVKSKEATDILIQILQEEDNKDLRLEVIDAFSKIGGIEVIQTLENLLENDSDDEMRIAAINALVEIKATNSGIILIATLYEDSNFNVRKHAGKALGLLGDATVIPPLVDVLQKDDEDETIIEIVKDALLKIGQRGYASALIGIIKNTEDIDIKDEATRMIVDIEPMKAIPELIEILNDEDSLIRSLT
ncbi:MAG: HEAT repeat domain-containing protein, partial [Candidatus Heimdallarchaeota archaeon]